MRRMLGRLGRVLLVAALLLAQHAALAHQYWHASASQTAQGQNAPKPQGDRLCGLHDLLGTVLGVAGGAVPVPTFLALSEPGFIAAPAAVREAALLAPHSRDPPLIS
jgi:hypothetical protein